MARIIGIISGKGGTGKTTVAINLAAALYKFYKKKALIVDCNMTMPNLGLYLGAYSTPITLNDALRGTEPIEKTIYKDISGIDIIPSSMKTEDMKELDMDILADKISLLGGMYEFIFLDSPPGLGMEAMHTLSACHEVISVTTPLVHNIADLTRCKHVCENMKIPEISIILNMVRHKSYEAKKSEVASITGNGKIFSIPYSEKIPLSTVKKKPAIELSSAIAKKFRMVSKLLVENEYEDEDTLISHILPGKKD